MDENEPFRLNVFVWRRRVNLLDEDKVMRRGDQVLTNLIFDLLPRLPRTASLSFHLWPDVGPGGHSAPLCIALLCLSWMTLCGSRLLPQMYGTI